MTLKQKNIVLIVGFLILIWIAYMFSFSKTVTVKQQLNNLKEQEALFATTSQNFQQLKQQDQYYSTLLQKHQISTESSFQNNLLKVLNAYAQETNLKIIEFKDPHRFALHSDKTIQETYWFTVEGDFNAILMLIYNFEQKNRFGKIVSVSFNKKKNYRTSKSYLQCTVYLQKLSQNQE